MYDLNLVAENLRKNRMEAYVVADRQAAYDKVKSLLTPGETVSVGGAKTLDECGILSLLRSGDYNFLDRYAEGLSKEQVGELFRDCFKADTYLCSSNAVTEDGVLYNVDGNSNRVTALAFGPKSVILVVGKNKIVKDLDEAVYRVKTVAAPLNAIRLNCKTPCAKLGHCISLDTMEHPQMADGCKTTARICCNYLVSGLQRVPGRIKVILVDEELGM